MIDDISVISREVSERRVDADDIAQYAYKDWNELFSEDRADVERFQLGAMQRRFEELMPKVAALRGLAEIKGVTSIRQLDDVVPLLFNHPEYKSYPISLIEKSRFDLLTNWLQRFTAVDLSGVDASQCTGIDDWIDTLEKTTPLQMYLTSGTTGKMSFIPRTDLERDLCNHCYLQGLFVGGFGDEPHIPAGGPDGIRVPVIYPSLRYGRFSSQRLVQHVFNTVGASPEDCYTLNNGTLSADLVSLSGRIRMAQAKGELSKMKLTEGQRIALRRYIEEQADRPDEVAEFFRNLIDKLRGERVLIFAQANYLYQATAAGLERGIVNAFAPDSIGCTGGGGKGTVLPPDWREQAVKFSGIKRWHVNYGMSELTSVFAGCPHGRYHLHPHIVPFLLDPETGAVLPREGKQTGRFAALDLIVQTYWGGTISGDRVTIEWDSTCPCGRKGAFVHDDVERYSSVVTGDDKITCAATIDNTDAALQKLLTV